MKHCTPKHCSLQAKTDISELFTPIPKTFYDHHREWWDLRNEEAASLSPGGRYAIAWKRTAIVESFPAWERPAVLDLLNRPLETIHDLFKEGVDHEKN